MIPPLAQMPRELWTWQVDVEIADLSTQENLATVGLGTPAPGRRNWPAYQHVGEQLSKEGWAGLVPRGHQLATVFGWLALRHAGHLLAINQTSNLCAKISRRWGSGRPCP